MILTPGTYTYTVQPIQSSNGTAAYLGVTSNMVDGRPGTQCPIQWPTGSQTTGTYMTIPFRAVAAATDTGLIRLVGVLGLKGIPAGTLVHVLRGNTANPVTFVAATTVQTLPNGSLGFWIFLPVADTIEDEYIGVKFFNNVSGSPAISAGATVYVGELFASEVLDFPVSDFGVEWTDPSRINRSSGNQPWPVLRKPFRKTNAKVVPQKFSAAFIASGNLQTLLFNLSRSKYYAIIPRPWARGAGTPDASYVTKMAQLVRGVSFGNLSSNASDDAWPLSLTFEELL